MNIRGTIIDGEVKLDEPSDLPNGTRVTLELEGSELDDFGFPPSETYERHLELLRESIEDAKAGRVVSARDVLKAIAIKRGFPLEPGE